MTTKQPPLFDGEDDDGQSPKDRYNAAEGERRKREAIDRAGSSVDALARREAAYDAVCAAARLRPEFTSDAARYLLLRAGGQDFAEPRAWGAVFRRAARDGFIEATGRKHKSADATCHRREKSVWRSLVYAAAEVAP